MKVLVTYASCHGSTEEIAEQIANRLRAAGDTVTCRPVAEVESVREFQAVVLGSAIDDQAWLPEATGFLERIGPGLAGMPVWLFSVGMPGALPGRLQGWAMQEEGQVATKLSGLVEARGHHLFSGVVRRQHLTAGGRARFRLMGGRYGDFRNWAEIDEWADAVADDIHHSEERSPA